MKLIVRLNIMMVLLIISQTLFSQEIDSTLFAKFESNFEQGKSVPVYYQYGFINCWGISDAQRRNWSIESTLLKYLEENQSVKIAILSHTNCRGDKEYNRLLTAVRSQNMKTWFLQRGISTMRINPIGKGGEEPIMDCIDRKNRHIEYETNDRIEIRKIESIEKL